MNLFDIPLIAAILAAAASALGALGTLVTPGLAIVIVTLAVRAALVPVGVSTAKAARTRRRLAPRIAEIQRRHRKNPQRLQEETLALYRTEKVSPFAGLLPMLAQLPVVGLVYALFALPTIAGEPNTLLSDTLAGISLGRHLGDLSAGLFPGDLLFLVLTVALGTIAWLNRRLTLRDAVASAPDAPGAALLNPSGPLSWAPFTVLIAVAVVPLAASIYLAVSGIWSYLERRVLRAVYRG